VSAQTIYNWRRQDTVDRGQVPGLSSAEQAELKIARRRIAQLEDKLAVIRRANELLKAQVMSPKDGSAISVPMASTLGGCFHHQES
jgi:transposase-like protein